jgi:hypothetical protein
MQSSEPRSYFFLFSVGYIMMPSRHRKQKRRLPMREVKRKQLCIGSRFLMLLAAAGLAAGHLELGCYTCVIDLSHS